MMILFLVLLAKLSTCQQHFDRVRQAFTSPLIDRDTVAGKISKNCCFDGRWVFARFQAAAQKTTYGVNMSFTTEVPGLQHDTEIICFSKLLKCKLFFLYIFRSSFLIRAFGYAAEPSSFMCE